MSNSMQTPPSSPPMKASNASEDADPPALAETMSLSPERATAAASMASSPENAHEEGRGHSRVATPSTPIRADELSGLASSSSRGVPQMYSTPGRSGPTSSGLGASNAQGSTQGHHLMSDLTPVISNSNTSYVDAGPGLSRPGMPGLLSSVPSGDGDFMAVSPGTLVGPRGSGRLSSRAAAMLSNGDEEDGLERSDSNGSGSALSSSARGLRQRRTRMPLPRAGLPPAKRSTSDHSNTSSMPGSGTGGAAAILRMPSSNASSDSSLRGDQLLISPSTAISSGDNESGLGLVGERLAMPSYASMYSDDEDDESVENSGNTEDSNGVSKSIFKNGGTEIGLAPIELRPDRKFFSFQGSNSYRRAVRSNDDAERLESIPSPCRPPTSPTRRTQPTSTTAQPMLSTMNQQGQYHPSLRSQHGVKEMADAGELSAIFKAPRQRPQQKEEQVPKVVTPCKVPMGSAFGHDEDAGSPMVIDQPHQGDKQPSLFQIRKEQEEGAEGEVLVPGPYPVESQWSIPSIRLANHVNQSSLGGFNSRNNDSYGDFSQCSLDDDESYYSFLDDDTASVSSRGSADGSITRRRISRVQLQHFQRMDSAQAQAEAEAANVGNGSGGNAEFPAIAQSNSFLERMQGIAIEGDAGTPATNTLDAAKPPVLSVEAPTTSMTMEATSTEARAVDAVPRSEDRRSRRKQRGRRQRKEGAAVEWIQDLQSQSTNVQLIAESASSKFLTVGTGGVGVANASPCGVTGGMGLQSQDVAKALGMPHPLCRSSTIEAGPFAVRHQGAGIHREPHLGSGGNSIALTSSGSGD